MSNKSNSVLYIGFTSNLPKRIFKHKNKLIKGFSSRYKLCKLVHFEKFESAYDGISREKQLKTWRREWKNNLIKNNNPQWADLYEDLL